MKPHYIQLIRYANRVLSLSISAFLLAMIAGDPIKPNGEETLALLFFPGGVIAGFLLAWKKEQKGALVSMLSLLLFYLYMYISRGNFPGGPYFLLITLTAVLFYVLSFSNRQAATKNQTT